MSNKLVMTRRERVLDAMAGAGIDVLVLGRQDNAAYACGMRRLWTAGTRPFGAGCIVVGSTQRAHALSSWDAGIEPPMTFEDLYPLTWNPRIMAASMAGIDGLVEADRIGVDELTPSFRRAAASFAPAAQVVVADDLMAGVRRHKLPGEVDAIARACEAAWIGVDTALVGCPQTFARVVGWLRVHAAFVAGRPQRRSRWALVRARSRRCAASRSGSRALALRHRRWACSRRVSTVWLRWSELLSTNSRSGPKCASMGLAQEL